MILEPNYYVFVLGGSNLSKVYLWISSESEPFREKHAAKYKVQDLYIILTWTEWSWMN